MKKKLSLFLALSLVLSLAACGKKEPEAEKLYTAGTYTESAQGYGGPVTVEITVDESKITAVKVTGDGETPSVGGAHLEELVSRGEVDLALAAIDSTSPRLSYELIEREVTGILAGGGSSLAGRFPPGTAVSVEDAAEDTFISLKEGHSIRVVQDALFHRYGLRPPILLETDSLEVAKRTALGTGSCMLCSDIYVDGMVRRRGAFYPLRDYENHRHFYACYPKGGALPQYAAGFIRIVKQVLEQRER